MVGLGVPGTYICPKICWPWCLLCVPFPMVHKGQRSCAKTWVVVDVVVVGMWCQTELSSKLMMGTWAKKKQRIYKMPKNCLKTSNCRICNMKKAMVLQRFPHLKQVELIRWPSDSFGIRHDPSIAIRGGSIPLQAST